MNIGIFMQRVIGSFVLLLFGATITLAAEGGLNPLTQTTDNEEAVSTSAKGLLSSPLSSTGFSTLTTLPRTGLTTERRVPATLAPSSPIKNDSFTEHAKKSQKFSSAEVFFRDDGGPNGAFDGGQHQALSVDLDLRQFGYDFFLHGDFTPDLQGVVGSDYVIGPGDSMRIDIWGTIEGNYPVTVDRKGEIVLPKVGVINLWGQTFTQAKETIHRQIDKYFKNFELNVTMGALRSIQVFFVGEVKTPGTYQVSSLSTLVTALSSAGGPTKSGSLRSIQLLRGKKIIRTIDLYDFFLRGDKSADIRLHSGDTIFVPMCGPLVGVAGNVRRPAIYELKGGETLHDTLTLAGGLVPTAYLQKVQVSRIEAHQSRIVLDFNLQKENIAAFTSQTKVHDRDLIKVAPIARTNGYVTLKGYVARPGNYQLIAGMRVKDLILNYDNLLPEFYPDSVQIIRTSPPEYQPEILTVNLDKVLQSVPEHNLQLQEYDTVQIFSREEMEELPTVSIIGAVLKAGSYRLYNKMTIKDLLSSAGNLKRDAYLAEAELTRYAKSGKELKSQRIVVDLNRVLAGDSEENIELQPYDRLAVRSVPDLSEKLEMEVRGKVLLPGRYSIHKGEKLSSILKRAGGFAKDAYLRGAFFSRESAKEIQKLRIAKLLFEQEQELARVAADIAAGALSPEEAASAQVIMTSRQAAINKLKRVPVVGRLVVHLQSLDKFTGSSDDLEVMPGDVINIPENPMSVTVLGQVYNPISLTYKSGGTVSSYLSQVGGITSNADEDQMFVIRADGTVYSKEQGGGGLKWSNTSHRWTFGGFNTAELYPGDSLLVPEKIDKTDFMRETMDLSTIIYQMALGAAAVASF